MCDGGEGSGQWGIGEDCGQDRTAAAGSAGDDAPIWGRNRIDGESMENRWDLIRTVGIDGKNKMIRNGTKEKRDDRRMRFFHTEPV